MTSQQTNDATLMIRLPSELKAELMKAAALNGRRITTEINIRLKASLNTPQPSNAPLVTVLHTGDATHNGLEQAMLKAFQALPVEKQLSLLTLLKS